MVPSIVRCVAVRHAFRREIARRERRDDQWKRIKELLPSKASDPGRTAIDNRKFVDAVLWIARSGAHWFPVWDVTVFTENRDRVLEGVVAMAFFEQVEAQAWTQHLLSDEHFTVDGTLGEA